MGNQAAKTRKRRNSYPGVSIKDFAFERNFMYNIGRGSFGRVLAMQHVPSSRHFAIKSVSKYKLVCKNQVENAMNEFMILTSLDHSPYVVNLWYAFQDENDVFMCIDLMLGGSLRHTLKHLPGGRLELERAKFYAAELALGVQFLHANGVVHRDIKPENLLLDSNGHIRLTDFNVSLRLDPADTTTRHTEGWGTSGFRAPEVSLRRGTGLMFACDWWSVGSTLYNMLVGQVPFVRASGEQSDEEMKRMAAMEFDHSWGVDGTLPNKESSDLITGLLAFKPEDRLGCEGGPNSEVLILTHPFFLGINWDGLETRDGSVNVPWKPVKKSRDERQRAKQRSKNGTRGSATSNSTSRSKNSAKAPRATAVEVIDAKLLVDNPFDVDGKRKSVVNGLGVEAVGGGQAPPVDKQGSAGKGDEDGGTPAGDSPTSSTQASVNGSRRKTKRNSSRRTRRRARTNSSQDSIGGYADNFDDALDHRERMRQLQRNMGAMGFDVDHMGVSSDEEEFGTLSGQQQQLFKNWQYNVDLKLDIKARPEFALLQQISAMDPKELKAWVTNNSSESLRMVCSEMKRFQEKQLTGNFERVQSELRIDELVQNNAKQAGQLRTLSRRCIRQHEQLLDMGADVTWTDEEEEDSADEHAPRSLSDGEKRDMVTEVNGAEEMDVSDSDSDGFGGGDVPDMDQFLRSTPSRRTIINNGVKEEEEGEGEEEEEEEAWAVKADDSQEKVAEHVNPFAEAVRVNPFASDVQGTPHVNPFGIGAGDEDEDDEVVHFDVGGNVIETLDL